MRGKINNSTTDFHHSHVVVAEEADGSTTDEDGDDYGREERDIQERREALRQRGRESYAKRKEGTLSSANTTPASTHGNRLHNPLHNGDGDDDDDDGGSDDDNDEGDVFYNESMGNGVKKPPRKKRKSGTVDSAYHPSDNGSDTEEDEGYHDQKPGSAKRRVSSGRLPGPARSPGPTRSPGPGRSPGPARSPNTMAVITTPPSRSKRQDTSNPIVSRFKEGSMRDRASVVPPREIVGTLPNSSPARPEDEEGQTLMGMSTRASGLSNIQSIGSVAARSTDNNGATKGSFTFGGLASFIPNPFKIVKDAKEAWDRQKQVHETTQRKKKILRDRKMRGQMAYMDLKKAGTMQGYSGNAAAVMGANAIAGGSSSRSTGVPLVSGNYRPDYTMGYEQSIGRAYSTDESRPVSRTSEQGGVGLRRRPELVTSFASDVTMKGTGESFGAGGPHRNSYETFETEQDKNNYEATRHNLDFVTSPCSENFSRKSISRSKVIVPPPPSRAPPPPPPLPSLAKATTNGGKFEDVKMLVKKKSKVFASTFGGRGGDEGMNTGSRATSREGPTKREIKRQEHLQKKVSNLEELLEKARRELENALDTTINGSVPPLPPMPKGSRWEGLPQPKTARESVLSGEDTEGEETEVDDTPLSPGMNGGSFGGSFMAKTAEMTIMERVEEAQHEPPEPANGKGKGSSRVFGILPKRTSKLNLGRRRVSGTATGTVSGSGSASVLRPQSKSMADMRGNNSPPPPQTPTEKVPPMPRLVGVNASRK